MSVILICGLNGCGKTTLGRELARVLKYSFLNDEDYWFLESDIPFSKCRSDEDAKATVMSFLEQNENCIIVASRGDLGAEINSKLDTVVYLSAPLEIRFERIKKRDSDRFADRVLEGGDMYEQQKKFYEFAVTRTTDKIKKWLESLSCDVICIDGRKSISENIDIILKAGIH